MIYALSALIGGLLLWLERNDTREHIGPLKLGSGFWTAIILLAGACLIREHHVELWRFALAFGLFAYVVTSSHNLILKPGNIQIVGEPRDILQKYILKAFSKNIGDYLGRLPQVVFAAVRYAIPISVMGIVMGNNCTALAGPLAAVIYWPWIDGDHFKRIRAAMLGALLGGVMVN